MTERPIFKSKQPTAEDHSAQEIAELELNEPDCRGRRARQPSDIPPRGWLDIAVRLCKELISDRVTLVAAGVAFYFLLSVFPAIAALVSIWGLFADPGDLSELAGQFYRFLGEETAKLLTDSLSVVNAKSDTSLGLTFLFALLGSFWSTRKGLAALIQAVNVAYTEPEKRGFFKTLLISFGFAILTIVMVLCGLSVVSITEFWAAKTSSLGGISPIWTALSWAFAAGVFLFWTALVYRYAPSRATPKWRWVTWGSTLALICWLIITAAFSIYVQQFDHLTKAYGSLTGVIALMLWFWLTAMSVLLGAEVNAEIEHQTAIDTTTGDPQPMGERGAYVADHLGRPRKE